MTQKEMLYSWCEKWVNAKLATIEERLGAAQAAANNEEKSSAGDKYETGRAMMHLEKEKLGLQFAETVKLKKVLHEINPSHPMHVAGLGALVMTSIGSFYIAISVGKMQIDNFECFGISLGSPIGQALKGRSPGEEFSFNGREISIKSVF